MEVKTKDIHKSCSCGRGCLGPLTFHPESKGRLVTLKEGGRRATRDPSSFRHGLAFSSRPIKFGEKVRLRVERSVVAWHGALRLGFTTVTPGSVTVPSLAIPELTNTRGFWATPVPEHCCSPRTELTFWVTRSGYLRVQTDDGYKHSVRINRLDAGKPIWAMIDLYGQTSAVLLLGSVKKGFFATRHSCPLPTISPTEQTCGYDQISIKVLEKWLAQKSLDEMNVSFPISQEKYTNDDHCVVCFCKPSNILLKCGHCCLCTECALRVISEFGTCPLCRQSIRPANT